MAKSADHYDNLHQVYENINIKLETVNIKYTQRNVTNNPRVYTHINKQHFELYIHVQHFRKWPRRLHTNCSPGEGNSSL